MNKSLLIAAVALTLPFSAAQAECFKKGPGFRFEQNQTVDYYFTTDNGRCGDSFIAGSRSVYTSASIVTPPQHGKLQQTGQFRFRYVSDPGYKGKDNYAVKVCGKSLAGTGCSTLNEIGTIE